VAAREQGFDLGGGQTSDTFLNSGDWKKLLALFAAFVACGERCCWCWC